MKYRIEPCPEAYCLIDSTRKYDTRKAAAEVSDHCKKCKIVKILSPDDIRERERTRWVKEFSALGFNYVAECLSKNAVQ